MYSKLLKRVQRHQHVSVLFQNRAPLFDGSVLDSSQSQQAAGLQRRAAPVVIVLPSSPTITAQQQIRVEHLGQPVQTQAPQPISTQDGLAFSSQEINYSEALRAQAVSPPSAPHSPSMTTPALPPLSPQPPPTQASPPHSMPPRRPGRRGSGVSDAEANALLNILAREAEKQGLERGKNDSFRSHEKSQKQIPLASPKPRNSKRRVVSKEELAKLTPRKPRPDRRSGVVYLSEDQKRGLEEVTVPEPQKIPVVDETIVEAGQGGTIEPVPIATDRVVVEEMELSDESVSNTVVEASDMDGREVEGESINKAIMSATAVEPPILETPIDTDIIEATAESAPSLIPQTELVPDRVSDQIPSPTSLGLSETVVEGRSPVDPDPAINQPLAQTTVPSHTDTGTSSSSFIEPQPTPVPPPTPSSTAPSLSTPPIPVHQPKPSTSPSTVDSSSPIPDSLPAEPASPPFSSERNEAVVALEPPSTPLVPTTSQSEPVTPEIPLNANLVADASPVVVAPPNPAPVVSADQTNSITPTGTNIDLPARENLSSVSQKIDSRPSDALSPILAPSKTPSLAPSTQADSTLSTQEPSLLASPSDSQSPSIATPENVVPISFGHADIPATAPQNVTPVSLGHSDLASSQTPSLAASPVLPDAQLQRKSGASESVAPPAEIDQTLAVDDLLQSRALPEPVVPTTPLTARDTHSAPVVTNDVVSPVNVAIPERDVEPMPQPQGRSVAVSPSSQADERPIVNPDLAVGLDATAVATNPAREQKQSSENLPNDPQADFVETAASIEDTYPVVLPPQQPVGPPQSHDQPSDSLELSEPLVVPSKPNPSSVSVLPPTPVRAKASLASPTPLLDGVIAQPIVKPTSILPSPQTQIVANESTVAPVSDAQPLPHQVPRESLISQAVSPPPPVRHPSEPILSQADAPIVPVRQQELDDSDGILADEPIALTGQQDLHDSDVVQPVSLEQVWPVEQQVEELQEPDVASNQKDYREPIYNPIPRRERNESLDQDVHDILQNVESAKSTDSKIEIVTPKRPRPQFARRRPAPAPVQPKNELAQNKITPDVPMAHEPSRTTTPSMSPEAAVPPAPMVDTPIGELPADLWSYIGEEPPSQAPILPRPELGQPTQPRPILENLNPIIAESRSGSEAVAPKSLSPTAVSHSPQIVSLGSDVTRQSDPVTLAPASVPVVPTQPTHLPTSAVETPIGQLPSSLWTAIGETPPNSPLLETNLQHTPRLESDVVTEIQDIQPQSVTDLQQDQRPRTDVPTVAQDLFSPSPQIPLVSDLSATDTSPQMSPVVAPSFPTTPSLVQPNLDMIVPTATAVASPTTDWRPSTQPLVVSTPAPSFAPTVSSIPSDTLVIQRTPADYLTSAPSAPVDKPIVVTETSPTQDMAVQRKEGNQPLDMSHVLPPRAIQRDSSTEDPGPKESHTSEAALPPAIDVDELARQVYDELKRRIARDWERGRRRYL